MKQRLTFAAVVAFAEQNGYVVEQQPPNSYTGRYCLWSNEKMPGVTDDYNSLAELYSELYCLVNK